MSGKSLDALQFDNVALRVLPIDQKPENERREVRGACFSRVTPAQVENPQLVAYATEALALLDISEEQVKQPDFVQYMSGNRLLRGSETAAHCYCGYQFGHFSGQLGDGAAIYLGEIINSSGDRWELQLKGAGRTPYSRQGDGRKVLRSSVREFLASEALHHLGIPTTRAGSLITSDSRVERDPVYSGDVIQERCSIVARIAPTFLRFGSFEIFKSTDSITGRAGPSAGLEGSMLPIMLHHTIRQYYPEIWSRHCGDSLAEVAGNAAEGGSSVQLDQSHGMYMDFLREVARRTASLVAAWQCVGFCHGVLNTDNMSIVGVTIDYGPYGFMDSFNPDYICNGSDDSGRYDYKSQPEICKWNLEKLAEALGPVLPVGRSRKEVGDLFDEEYSRVYRDNMRRKLGLLASSAADASADDSLIAELMETMCHTGADFTNTFRNLSKFPMPESTGLDDDSEVHQSTLNLILGECSSATAMADARRPRIPLENLHMLLMLGARDPMLLHQFGTSVETLKKELKRSQASEEFAKMSTEQKANMDRTAWIAWLQRYRTRLLKEARAGADPAKRVETMDGCNPRYVLRNWMAQQAIEHAEAGNYGEVMRLLDLLKTPFTEIVPEEQPHALKQEAGGPSCQLVLEDYSGPVPQRYKKLCVTCSS